MTKKPAVTAVASAFYGGKEINKTWNYEVSEGVVRAWLEKRGFAAATVHYRANNNRTNWEIHVRAAPIA